MYWNEVCIWLSRFGLVVHTTHTQTYSDAVVAVVVLQKRKKIATFLYVGFIS